MDLSASNKKARLHLLDSPSSNRGGATQLSSTDEVLGFAARLAEKDREIELLKQQLLQSKENAPLSGTSSSSSRKHALLPSFSLHLFPTDLLEVILSYTSEFDVVAICASSAARGDDDEFMQLCCTTTVWQALVNSPLEEELRYFMWPDLPLLRVQLADLVLTRFHTLWQGTSDAAKFECAFQKDSMRMIRLLQRLERFGYLQKSESSDSEEAEEENEDEENESMEEANSQEGDDEESQPESESESKSNGQTSTGDVAPLVYEDVAAIINGRGNYPLTMPRDSIVTAEPFIGQYFGSKAIRLISKKGYELLDSLIFSSTFSHKPSEDVQGFQDAVKQIQHAVAKSQAANEKYVKLAQKRPPFLRRMKHAFDLILASILIRFHQLLYDGIPSSIDRRYEIGLRLDRLLCDSFVVPFFEEEDRECRETILAQLIWYRHYSSSDSGKPSAPAATRANDHLPRAIVAQPQSPFRWVLTDLHQLLQTVKLSMLSFDSAESDEKRAQLLFLMTHGNLENSMRKTSGEFYRCLRPLHSMLRDEENFFGSVAEMVQLMHSASELGSITIHARIGQSSAANDMAISGIHWSKIRVNYTSIVPEQRVAHFMKRLNQLIPNDDEEFDPEQ